LTTFLDFSHGIVSLILHLIQTFELIVFTSYYLMQKLLHDMRFQYADGNVVACVVGVDE